MRLGILQPSYLPWLGFFDQMNRVDTFVYLDDVQFTRRDWRNRNRIRTREGWAWLTVPVLQKHRFKELLRETRIDNSVAWSRKHREAIRANYAQSPFFDLYFPALEPLYNKPWEFLLDLCFEMLRRLKLALEISTRTVNASDLEIPATKGDKILTLCETLGATHYLSGDASKRYLPEEEFRARGIALEYQNYQHPVYNQRYPGFVPYLSVIDLLFNMGAESLNVLSGTHRTQSTRLSTGADRKGV